ncbi:MAG: trypsin-like peptidase domain-containing protein [Tabrizicola sp.]|nr:trypsin-like peptidase domain-containing protein [Tabrizicola sp.]
MSRAQGLIPLLLSLALPATEAVGQENSGLDPLITREDLRGFEPVGRIDIAGAGFCTGTLIAADLVLTAAHCVFEPDGAPIAADRITFRAGFSYGVSLVDAGVARTIVPKDYRMIEPAPVAVIAADVALLQLAEPIPSGVISPFVIALPGTGDEVSVVSYAAGREEALSWQRACQVVARQGGLIATDCDVTFGASGAPVLDRSGYRARIVSIISVGAEVEGKRVAVGMELPDLVADLKAALYRGEATSAAVPARDDGTAKRIFVGDGNQTGAKVISP